MPREKIEDPGTPGLFVQVNWRRHDEVSGFDAPGHVQISTHNERQDVEVARLLDEAGTLLSFLTSVIASGEQLSERDHERLQAWRDRRVQYAPELTGTYITLTPETIRKLVRLLHRGRGQGYGHGRPPRRPETALRELPAGAETEPCG